MAPDNPFRPSFGSSPPLLAGRAPVLAAFGQALDAGPGTPGWITAYRGARGVGKTVMLNAAEDEARRRGWEVIPETASAGLLDRLGTEHLPSLLRRHDPAAVRRRLSSLNVTIPGGVGGGATWDTIERYIGGAGLRTQLFLLADLLSEGETGLLITVDEVQLGAAHDLRALAPVLQHAVREGKSVAFACAGLPHLISETFDDRGLTFFRRAKSVDLGALGYDDVAEAIEKPINATKRRIKTNALDYAVRASRGYPYLVQLVGHHIWAWNPSNPVIEIVDATLGVAEAIKDLGPSVHEPALKDVSERDRDFLVAMSVDEGPSTIGDIIQRLEVSPGYAQQYRKRLLDAELVVQSGRGKLDLALPHLRQYLRQHPDRATGVAEAASWADDEFPL
jgi:hypothetical protein